MWRRLLWWRPPCLLRAVIVNLRESDGQDATAIRGVMWSARGPWLTFRDASLLKAGQEPARIDGEVVMHRDVVLFVQVMP
jgi:hypothetical protein